jgi:hypothetical protein
VGIATKDGVKLKKFGEQKRPSSGRRRKIGRVSFQRPQPPYILLFVMLRGSNSLQL